MVFASLFGSFICSKESKLFQIGPRILLEEKLAKHNELATVPLNRLLLRKRSYCWAWAGAGAGMGMGGCESVSSIFFAIEPNPASCASIRRSSETSVLLNSLYSITWTSAEPR